MNSSSGGMHFSVRDGTEKIVLEKGGYFYLEERFLDLAQQIWRAGLRSLSQFEQLKHVFPHNNAANACNE